MSISIHLSHVEKTRHARTNIRIYTNDVIRLRFHKFYDFFSNICVNLKVFIPLTNKSNFICIFRIIIITFSNFLSYIIILKIIPFNVF